MRKIIIGVEDNFIKDAYHELFIKAGFQVFITSSGREVISLAKEEKPDIIVTSVALTDLSGLDVLEELKKDDLTKRIPVIIRTLFERQEEKERAIKWEARDYIASNAVTPVELVLRIKSILGEERSYRMPLSEGIEDIERLVKDISGKEGVQCEECGENLFLYLIRDFSKGKNYFKLSLICKNCNKK